MAINMYAPVDEARAYQEAQSRLTIQPPPKASHAHTPKTLYVALMDGKVVCASTNYILAATRALRGTVRWIQTGTDIWVSHPESTTDKHQVEIQTTILEE